MLFQKDIVELNNTIYLNTQQDKETIVRMGSKIGTKATLGKEQEQCQ
jgi:hypothetical protein